MSTKGGHTMSATKTIVTEEVNSVPSASVRASELGFDFVGCPRCFFLSVKEEVDKPSMPPSSIFSRVEKFAKEMYIDRGLLSVVTDAPKGELIKSNVVVKSDPVLFNEPEFELTITGRFDFLFQLKDGTYAIVAFKSGDPSKNIEAYARQLNAYAYALETATKPEVQKSPVTRLGIFAFDPVLYMQDGKAPESLQWHEVKRESNEHVVDMLNDVARLLANGLPDYTSTCAYCKRDIQILARNGVEV
jgi:CRISPR/Cas system-associated exonuclease Cas4 (RecB family)